MKNKVFSNTVCFRSASHLSHEGIHSDLRYLSQKLETSRENLNTNLKYITYAFFLSHNSFTCFNQNFILLGRGNVAIAL